MTLLRRARQDLWTVGPFGTTSSNPAAEIRRLGPVQAVRPRNAPPERVRPRTAAGLTAGAA